MTTTQIREQLSDEIRQIPDAALEQALNLLHGFRLALAGAPPAPAAGVMRFAGAWLDAPGLDGMEEDLADRRRSTFKTRRTDAAGAH